MERRFKGTNALVSFQNFLLVILIVELLYGFASIEIYEDGFQQPGNLWLAFQR